MRAGNLWAEFVGWSLAAGRDQWGQDGLGVESMTEVVRVIEAVSGQVEVMFGPEQPFPNRGDVGQRDAGADERFQLVALECEHVTRRVDPLGVAQHR